MRFQDFPLDEAILRGVEEARFESCMPVQEMVLQTALGGRDVTVQSQTGSGKTAAFLLVLFQQMLERRRDPAKPRFAALVLVPTRELAVQIEDEARMLGKHLEFRVVTVYGGVGYGRQTEGLKADPEFVVGTPGRLLDLVRSRRLDLKRFTHLVIDEADRMLDMGFYPDIERIVTGMLPPSQRQTMLFSATLGEDVKALAARFMRDPVDITVEPEKVTVETIRQELYHVGEHEKLSLLLGLLRKKAPSSAIVFTNTKRMAEELARRLKRNGFEAEYIIGDLPQSRRLRIIEDIKKGRLRLLVATDVASRGLHIDDLAMVVNYDLPENPENYVHRIGRTARAGKEGLAVTLACESDVEFLEPIQHYINMKIPVVWPEESDFVEDRSGGGRQRGGERPGRSGDRRSGQPLRREDRIKQAIAAILESGSSSPSAAAGSEGKSEAGAVPERREGGGVSRGGKGAEASERKGEGGGGRRRRRGRGGRGKGGDSGTVEARRGGGKGEVRSGGAGREASAAEIAKHAGKHVAGLKRPGRGASLEERLAYYRRVYGEDFRVRSESGGGRKGFWGWLAGVFGRRKGQ